MPEPRPFPENTYISKERPTKSDEDLRRLVLRHYNLDSYEVDKAVFKSVSRDFEDSNMLRIFTLSARYSYYFFLFDRVHQMHALFLCCYVILITSSWNKCRLFQLDFQKSLLLGHS